MPSTPSRHPGHAPAKTAFCHANMDADQHVRNGTSPFGIIGHGLLVSKALIA